MSKVAASIAKKIVVFGGNGFLGMCQRNSKRQKLLTYTNNQSCSLFKVREFVKLQLIEDLKLHQLVDLDRSPN